MKKTKGRKCTFGVSPFLFCAMVLFAMTAWVGASNDAPDRPDCPSLGSCHFNEPSTLGPGSRIVLFDQAGGHGTSRTFLRNALERLQQEHNFELTMTRTATDFTDNLLSDTKVIIFSNGDGDLGGSIPPRNERERIEAFVEERGWGFLMIHAACAYIDSWPWLQDVCVQQYYHHNGSGTRAEIYIEDRTVDNDAHGRANPYTDFLLEGLDDRVSMADEWYTWRGAPRTTHQYNRTTTNKNMLMAADEATYNNVTPAFPNEHYLAWTHTMGRGVVLYNSMGHDDTYSEGGDYGDEFLWRSLRYVAKDWTGDATPVNNPAGSKHKNAVTFSSNVITIDLDKEYSVRVTNVNGETVFSKTSLRFKSYDISGLEAGIYFVTVTAGDIELNRKIFKY